MKKITKTILLLGSVGGLVGCSAGPLQKVDYTTASGIALKAVAEAKDVEKRGLDNLHCEIVESGEQTHGNDVMKMSGTCTLDIDMSKMAFSVFYDENMTSSAYTEKIKSYNMSYYNEELGIIDIEKTELGDFYYTYMTVSELNLEFEGSGFTGEKEEFIKQLQYYRCISSDAMEFCGYMVLEPLLTPENYLKDKMNMKNYSYEFKSNGVELQGKMTGETKTMSNYAANYRNYSTAFDIEFDLKGNLMKSCKYVMVESREARSASDKPFVESSMDVLAEAKSTNKPNIQIPDLSKYVYMGHRS